MAEKALYPEGPRDVPANFTAPSARYQLQALLVLCALGLFVLLYFGLMLFSVAFAVWAILLCSWEGDWIYIKLGSLLLAGPFGVLFIFLFKNLLKSERAQKEFLIEIFEDEHPRLFDFIRQVCDETGATYPQHVYLDYAVNAAAIPDRTSFFHLFLPTGKSLLIGLGLVNACNLTEFKAMLAHEFGHFAQKGMKLGSYIYTALRICDHVVYGQDGFDRFINAWSQWHGPAAWPAWIIRGILWALRKLLGAMFFVVCYFHFALKRQMEFNADLVAVSVTGSDAPVSLLHRCVTADECFTQAVRDLRVAMSHHLYTNDLFHHQTAARAILRVRKKDPRFGDPPDPAETPQVFKEDDERLAAMWATHPKVLDRERNAKAHYIPSQFDDRSPWLLFDNVAELRMRVTARFYRFHFKIPHDVLRADAVEVQGFIDDEHADRTYDARYHGLYDGRNLHLKGMRKLARSCVRNPRTAEELRSAVAALYSGDVKERAQLYYQHKDEFNLLTALLQGWIRPKNGNVEFRGATFAIDDAGALLKQVATELGHDSRWLKSFDRQVFEIHFQMAWILGKPVARELYRRYAFHLRLQRIWYKMREHDEPISSAVQFMNLQSSSGLTGQPFQPLRKIFHAAHRTMRRQLKAAHRLKLPALKNLPAGSPLRPFLLADDLQPMPDEWNESLSERWIVRFLEQFRDMKSQVDRIHFKSLVGILALQERL